MKILIWAECKKLRRSNIVFLTVFAVVMIAVILFIGGKSIDSGFQGMDDPGWYMIMAQPWATLFVLPAVIALLGSYMICREEQEDTVNLLRLIPVSETKLAVAKMIVTFVFSILIYLLLFALTFLSEAVLHIHELTVEMVLGFLKSYFLEGVCVFLAISPIIALVSYKKKNYWLALVLAEMYSFAGMFMSMSNALRTFYPISAVLGVSGYYETTAGNRLESMMVLLFCGCLSAFILKRLKYNEK